LGKWGRKMRKSGTLKVLCRSETRRQVGGNSTGEETGRGEIQWESGGGRRWSDNANEADPETN